MDMRHRFAVIVPGSTSNGNSPSCPPTWGTCM
jgi:hypothetical protein